MNTPAKNLQARTGFLFRFYLCGWGGVGGIAPLVAKTNPATFRAAALGVPRKTLGEEVPQTRRGPVRF
jgi:hypothetical protein